MAFDRDDLRAAVSERASIHEPGDPEFEYAQQILRDYLRPHLMEGERCPVCTLFAKMYKRKLNSAMAVALVLLARKDRKDPGEWVHAERYFKGLAHAPTSLRGDLGKIPYWGLLERNKVDRGDGSNRTGYYRITEKGHEFVAGRIQVKSHCLIYDGRPFRLTGDMIDIHQALTEKFDYNELMGF